jgi:hypothetical protein
MKRAGSLALLAVVVALTTACGSSRSTTSLPTDVRLQVGTKATGGKALVFTARTDRKVAAKKGALYAMQLRGIGSGGSFDHPGYVDRSQCVGGSSCEWTVAPDKAGDYEYEVYLLDMVHDDTAGASNAVKVSWAAPPRPTGITLFVNGKTPPSVPLTGDHYNNVPAGPMQVEAKWTTDARNTGYYLTITDDSGVSARCSVGTLCRIPKAVSLGPGAEDSWQVELLTTRGDKVAEGFKVCLRGAATSRT